MNKIERADKRVCKGKGACKACKTYNAMVQMYYDKDDQNVVTHPNRALFKCTGITGDHKTISVYYAEVNGEESPVFYTRHEAVRWCAARSKETKFDDSQITLGHAGFKGILNALQKLELPRQ